SSAVSTIRTGRGSRRPRTSRSAYSSATSPPFMSNTPGPVATSPSTLNGATTSRPTGQTVSKWPSTSTWPGPPPSEAATCAPSGAASAPARRSRSTSTSRSVAVDSCSTSRRRSSIKSSICLLDAAARDLRDCPEAADRLAHRRQLERDLTLGNLPHAGDAGDHGDRAGRVELHDVPERAERRVHGGQRVQCRGGCGPNEGRGLRRWQADRAVPVDASLDGDVLSSRRV